VIKLSDAIADVLSPRNGQGEVEFSAFWHEVRLDRYPFYREWWGGLAEADRERLTAEVQLHDDAQAKEKARAEDELAARREADAKREAAAARPRLIGRGVPARLADAILRGALEETDAIRLAKAFTASRRTILVISGVRGAGKTVAAAWLVAQYPFARFIDVSRLARLSRYSEEDMAPLEECALLAIDDLGTEYADDKGSFMATLDGLVNARYADERRTVITTNLQANTFKARYGERIADRIREAGRFVELASKSLRGRRAEP
jgi:DNA replication protein DnaC